eukprot:CAMPEP_0206398878 /NCGR_PEP_ID=MMETSP0294-20121207/24444_1 /ASSEMBLY_ACC=CAM_ASM_000327 /TAXON_ID=39354 /ORGANISM="Heterosigma akashiwo, Strain CCMP2393" /LENGTH=184 /DNA_ID=CAMNT_0053854487 /DNA_START=337 /DNA_END=889 /DNA_ORIENTATION=+
MKGRTCVRTQPPSIWLAAMASLTICNVASPPRCCWCTHHLKSHRTPAPSQRRQTAPGPPPAPATGDPVVTPAAGGSRRATTRRTAAACLAAAARRAASARSPWRPHRRPAPPCQLRGGPTCRSHWRGPSTTHGGPSRQRAAPVLLLTGPLHGQDLTYLCGIITISLISFAMYTRCPLAHIICLL